MRLTEQQKMAVMDSCDHTRPNASLRKIGGTWGVVWSVEIDKLVCPVTKVPSSQRWRCQLLTKYVSPTEIWWSGEEHQGKTRKGVIDLATDEASHHGW